MQCAWRPEDPVFMFISFTKALVDLNRDLMNKRVLYITMIVSSSAILKLQVMYTHGHSFVLASLRLSYIQEEMQC